MILRRLWVAPLLLVLFTGRLSAATTSGQRSPETWRSDAGSIGWLSEAWTFGGRLWRKAESSVDFFEKAGGSTDPFGNPAPTTIQALPAITPPEGHSTGK